MDNDDNKNNNNKTSGKRSLDFNNLKRPKPTTRSSTRSTRSTRSSTSMNIEVIIFNFKLLYIFGCKLL
jgi:hypothetical protein